MKVPRTLGGAVSDRDDVPPVGVVLPHLGWVCLGLPPLGPLEPLPPVPLLPEELGPPGTYLAPLPERVQDLLWKLGLQLDLARLALLLDLVFFFLVVLILLL